MDAIRGNVAIRAWNLFQDPANRDVLAGVTTTVVRNLLRVVMEATAVEELWIVLEYQSARRFLSEEAKRLIHEQVEAALKENEGASSDDRQSRQLDVVRSFLGHLARLQRVVAESRRPDRGGGR